LLPIATGGGGIPTRVVVSLAPLPCGLVLFILVILGCLLMLIVRNRRLALLLDRRVMRSINVVVDIAIVISHSRLLRGEPPLIVHYELVLVHSTL
jgi:uncharacterized protein (DUF58 family)